MLNLEKAADIMRRELFEPLGVVVPPIPVAYEDMKGRGEAVTHVTEGEATSVGVDPNFPPLTIAANLAHELIHVAGDNSVPVFFVEYNGHDAQFREIAQAIGLKLVQPWYTQAGDKFRDFFEKHIDGKA